MPKVTVEQVPLGRSGLTTSSIGLGCVTFGREIDRDTSFDLLDYALENGINFLDTAEAYGGGNSQISRKQTYGVSDQREVTTEMHSSETIIGRWLKKTGNRDHMIICTKCSTGNKPENIREKFNASLERLQVDYVDV